jgi:beta-phosphoglucomutase
MTEMEAVIFDMDGVLADSNHAHLRSWREVAAAMGLSFGEAEFRRTLGRTSREVIALIWGGSLSEAEVAALDARKEAVFRRIVDADYPTMPGALALLTALRAAGFRLALGSSAPRENVEQGVERMRLEGVFGAIICGNDVTRGKPDPEIFLTAAQRIGVAPHRCAVIEDAPAGIAAAAAAGMACIALAGTGHTRPALAAADLIVDSLAELTPAVFRRVIAAAQA